MNLLTFLCLFYLKTIQINSRCSWDFFGQLYANICKELLKLVCYSLFYLSRYFNWLQIRLRGRQDVIYLFSLFSYSWYFNFLSWKKTWCSIGNIVFTNHDFTKLFYCFQNCWHNYFINLFPPPVYCLHLSSTSWFHPNLLLLTFYRAKNLGTKLWRRSCISTSSFLTKFTLVAYYSSSKFFSKLYPFN